MYPDQSSDARIICVLVADNTRIYTQLLSEVLRRDRGLKVISSDSGSSGILAAANANAVDVLLISDTLDEEPGRGFEVLRGLRVSHPEIRTVMLLDSSKRDLILDAFRAGVKGIFSKQESIETLSKCVWGVYQGQIWANSQQMAYAVEALASTPTVRAVDAKGLNLLSKREMEVVRSLAEGLTNREIAERLGLSQHTIKNYLFRVFDKLGVSSRIELLFMTLSPHGQSQSKYLAKAPSNGHANEAATVAEYQKAAEQGVPIAQLALAQLFRARQSDPTDMVFAYMWYLIAGEQIMRARKEISARMSMEQLVEAEKKAANWLARPQKYPPATDNPAGRRATAAGGTAD